MEFTSRTQDALGIITVEANRIDAAVAIKFKDRMREEMADAQGRMVLDLHNVDFIDSSGLGAIVAVMKLMPAGAKLELAGLTPAVDKVFRMTRMDSIFSIHHDVNAAVAA
jgi:anti-sigma B factor antagonist